MRLDIYTAVCLWVEEERIVLSVGRPGKGLHEGKEERWV